MTLAPGERRTLSLASSDVPVQAMQAFMQIPERVVHRSRFSLRDADGRDFDFQMGDVLQQTAIVDVDYGTARSATSSRPTPIQPRHLDRARAGRAACRSRRSRWTWTGSGRGGVRHRDRRPRDGVPHRSGAGLGDRLPYSATAGPPAPHQARLVRGRHPLGGREEVQFYPNLFDAPLYPGDRMTLIYTEDIDRDGVSAYEESRAARAISASIRTAGRAPRRRRSLRLWEVHEGWTVETRGARPIASTLRRPPRQRPRRAARRRGGRRHADGLRDRHRSVDRRHRRGRALRQVRGRRPVRLWLQPAGRGGRAPGAAGRVHGDASYAAGT